MNVEQLKTNLNYLVETYIMDSAIKCDLKKLIQNEGVPPVKFIMAEIQSKGRPIDQKDGGLVKDIAFFFM